jgi:hypothetical protein
MKPKQKPVKPTNVIHCLACSLDIDLQAAGGEEAFKRHMLEKHQVGELKGSRTMAKHMDGSNWFSYEWNWDIGGVKLVQRTTQPRSREDQAYWDATGD